MLKSNKLTVCYQFHKVIYLNLGLSICYEILHFHPVFLHNINIRF